jgi:hypothetical protein
LLQAFDVWENHLLLVFHVLADAVGILVVELHDEPGEIIGLVEGILKVFADGGQLEIEEIGVARLEISHQRGNRQSPGIVVVAISVDGVIDDGKEGVSVYTLVFTHLFHGLVTKPKVDAEGSEAL